LADLLQDVRFLRPQVSQSDHMAAIIHTQKSHIL
jgi:hypothetical protein